MSAETLDELRSLATRLLDEVVALRADGPPPPKLLTLEQAAKALEVSRGTVQNLVNAGQLAVVSVTDRAPRVDTRDIEEFIKRRRERRGR